MEFDANNLKPIKSTISESVVAELGQSLRAKDLARGPFLRVITEVLNKQVAQLTFGGPTGYYRTFAAGEYQKVFVILVDKGVLGGEHAISSMADVEIRDKICQLFLKHYPDRAADLVNVAAHQSATVDYYLLVSIVITDEIKDYEYQWTEESAEA